MATTYYEAEDVFVLKSKNNSLELNVKTGDGQGGGYLIFKDTELIGSNKKITLKNLDDLINKWLTFVVVIKDKMEETNWTSVTVIIQEQGSELAMFGPYKREVQNHLDTVCYSIKIKIQEKK